MHDIFSSDFHKFGGMIAVDLGFLGQNSWLQGYALID